MHIPRRKPLAVNNKGRTVRASGSETPEPKHVRHRDSLHGRSSSRREPHSGPTQLFHPIEALQEPLPPEELWVDSGRLQKRVVAQDVSWQERLVVLTNNSVFLARMDTRRVGESIPLSEIESVTKAKADDLTSMNNAAQEVPKRERGSFEIRRSKSFLSRSTSPTGNSMVFEIKTSRDGHFNGRTYSLRCESEEDCDDWVQKIIRLRRDAVDREEAANKKSQIVEYWHQLQGLCYRIFHSAFIKWSMSLLVALNFVVAIAEAERVPEIESYEWWYFYHAEIVFTTAFSIELMLNMIGHWFKPFWEMSVSSIAQHLTCRDTWQDRWSVFDFVVVLCSIIVIPLSDLPGFAILRLFRVFRVMRLFRMMKPLRVLIRALAASVVPVLNAFAILSIITCLYAVMGVQLFGEGTPDRFDRFSNAFFTMVQVCTGDGWAEAVARPMWHQHSGSQVSFFFVSYILIAGTFLLNIVVAVLLDEFISSVEKDKQTPIEEARVALEEEFFKDESPLDPLVSTLTQYTSNEDLDKQIQDIFELLDWRGKGSVSFLEMHNGLRRLPFEPPIMLTSDDFEQITLQYKLCQVSGEVDSAAFTTIMRMQLRRFVQKYLNLKCMEGSQDNTWMILSLKQMLLGTDLGGGGGGGKKRGGAGGVGGGGRRGSVDCQSESEDRLERLVLALNEDMQLVKQALGIPTSQPASTVAGTPQESRPASPRSWCGSSLVAEFNDNQHLFKSKRRSSLQSGRRRSSVTSVTWHDSVAGVKPPTLLDHERERDRPRAWKQEEEEEEEEEETVGNGRPAYSEPNSNGAQPTPQPPHLDQAPPPIVGKPPSQILFSAAAPIQVMDGSTEPPTDSVALMPVPTRSGPVGQLDRDPTGPVGPVVQAHHHNLTAGGVEWEPGPASPSDEMRLSASPWHRVTDSNSLGAHLNGFGDDPAQLRVWEPGAGLADSASELREGGLFGLQGAGVADAHWARAGPGFSQLGNGDGQLGMTMHLNQKPQSANGNSNGQPANSMGCSNVSGEESPGRAAGRMHRLGSWGYDEDAEEGGRDSGAPGRDRRAEGRDRRAEGCDRRAEGRDRRAEGRDHEAGWRGRMLDDAWEDTRRSGVWDEETRMTTRPPDAAVTAQLVVPTSQNG